MEIRHTKPSRLFVATGGGAGLNSHYPCRHGVAAVSLHLLREVDGTTDDIGVVLPRCAAAMLIGSALAYIQAADGEEAADEFLADMNEARVQAAQQITEHLAERRAAQAAACCEAGYRTAGCEHTCSPADRSSN